MLIWHPATPGLLAVAASSVRIFQSGDAPDSPTDWVSTVGPFGAAIALSYFLLRRSDSREAEARAAYRITEMRLLDELTEERRRNAELVGRLKAAEGD